MVIDKRPSFQNLTILIKSDPYRNVIQQFQISLEKYCGKVLFHNTRGEWYSLGLKKSSFKN